MGGRSLLMRTSCGRSDVGQTRWVASRGALTAMGSNLSATRLLTIDAQTLRVPETQFAAFHAAISYS